jgi:hypothetical protein
VVRIRRRILKQKYKRNQDPYKYPRYSLEFPAKLNKKIEPLLAKVFDITITFEDAPKQEVVNISLVRKKTGTEEAGNKKLL